MVAWLFALTVAFLAPPVELKLSQRVGMAPITLNVTVRAEPKATNRGLFVIIDGDNYYRSSFDPDFMGEDSPSIRTYQYDLRAEGHYTIGAILKRTAPDNDVMATETLCLSGPNTEC